MRRAKRPRATLRQVRELEAQIRDMASRLDLANSLVASYKRQAEQAIEGQRKAGREVAAMQKRAQVRGEARAAALASSSAMMDFAARIAPMIMEGRPREELIALIEECTAMRFREERALRAKVRTETQQWFDAREDEP